VPREQRRVQDGRERVGGGVVVLVTDDLGGERRGEGEGGRGKSGDQIKEMVGFHDF